MVWVSDGQNVYYVCPSVTVKMTLTSLELYSPAVYATSLFAHNHLHLIKKNHLKCPQSHLLSKMQHIHWSHVLKTHFQSVK